MGISVCVSAGVLRKALADLERAERSGFMYCLAVLEVGTVGTMLKDCTLSYDRSDLWVRAHPTDGNLDWGRGMAILGHQFINGKVVLKDQ